MINFLQELWTPNNLQVSTNDKICAVFQIIAEHLKDSQSNKTLVHSIIETVEILILLNYVCYLHFISVISKSKVSKYQTERLSKYYIK